MVSINRMCLLVLGFHCALNVTLNFVYRFIVSYFLSDDTILVFEPPQRNSGILGGKFLERGRIKKPDGVNYFVAPVSTVCFVLFLMC